MEWKGTAQDQGSFCLKLKHRCDVAHETISAVANLAAAVLDAGAAAAAVQMLTIAVEAHLPHPQTPRDLQFNCCML